ncbi:MAG: glycosyltransferase family 1 protein [Sphingobacteriaceae bacterium]
MKPLNIFYEEPKADRWTKFDRYPRMVIRRLLRGKQRPGGVMMVAINLMAGLDKLGIPYRFNDYRYIRNHPKELACIIGKPNVLFQKKWVNPILFGAGIFSHPIECPDLFEKYPNVKHILVPGEWMREMFIPYYGNRVSVWPTGIDTDKWQPSSDDKEFDFLIYDKIRWEYPYFEKTLLHPIAQSLKNNGLSFQTIRYGNYSPEELSAKIKQSKAVIFLCEHETQGIAYQQILATNTPILAWDRGGYWQDPYYYPNKVKYQPVSSVPYWDERCGMTFKDINEFNIELPVFLEKLKYFSPRDYILKNLTLALSASAYIKISEKINAELI